MVDWQGIAAVIAAVTSLVTAVGGMILASRARATMAGVAEVAHTVNSAQSAMLARINSLTAMMTHAGLPVPADPNLPAQSQPPSAAPTVETSDGPHPVG